MILSERKAELVKANSLAKELLAQHESSLDCVVRYDGSKPVERRWQVWLRANFTFVAGSSAPAEEAALADAFKTEALLVSAPTWPEAGEKFFEWLEDPDKQARLDQLRDRLLRGQALDVEVPETEKQRLRREDKEHKLRIAREQQNEILKRQVRYVLEKKGLDNVPGILKILRRM